MKILILDDDEAIVRLLTRACAADGHEVSEFTVPAEAIKALGEGPFDLLVTDLAMPGVNGMAVTRAAQKLQPSLFTLIITGHAGAFPIEQVLNEGNVDVMFKPFHLNEFRARVALSGRRKRVLDGLQTKQHRLQAVSAEMIHGLEAELQELRKASTPFPTDSSH
jgi:DNA-binding response OmpR family regulator